MKRFFALVFPVLAGSFALAENTVVRRPLGNWICRIKHAEIARNEELIYGKTEATVNP